MKAFPLAPLPKSFRRNTTPSLSLSSKFKLPWLIEMKSVIVSILISSILIIEMIFTLARFNLFRVRTLDRLTQLRKKFFFRESEKKNRKESLISNRKDPTWSVHPPPTCSEKKKKERVAERGICRGSFNELIFCSRWTKTSHQTSKFMISVSFQRPIIRKL